MSSISPPSTANTPPPPSRLWVLPCLFGSFFAVGALRPEMPGILLDLFDGDMSTAATYQGICDGIGAMIAFLLVPWLGHYSDTHGRRPGLAITAFCSTAAVFILNIHYLLSFSNKTTIVLFFIANLLSKVTTQSVAFSYVADCSKIEDRSSALLEAGAFIYIAATAGPFVGRYFSRDQALLVAGFLSLLSIVCVYFIPESYTHIEEHKPAADGKNYGTVSPNERPVSSHGRNVSHPPSKGGILVGLKFLGTNQLYIELGLICFFSQISIMGVGQIYYLYLTNEFDFQRQDNTMAAIIGSLQTCLIMLLQPWLSKRFSMSSLMAFAMACYSVYCLGLGVFAQSKMEIYLLIFFFGLAHTMFTNTSALLATVTMPHHLGLAMSALSGVKAFASGVGPAIFAFIFGRMVAIKEALLGPERVSFKDDTANCLGVHCTAIPLMLGCLIALLTMLACLFLPVSVATKKEESKDNKTGASPAVTPAHDAHDEKEPAKQKKKLHMNTVIKVVAALRRQVASTPHGEDYHFQFAHIGVPTKTERAMNEERKNAENGPVTVAVQQPVTTTSSSASFSATHNNHHLTINSNLLPKDQGAKQVDDSPALPNTPKFVEEENDDPYTIPMPPARSNWDRFLLLCFLLVFIGGCLAGIRVMGSVVNQEEPAVAPAPAPTPAHAPPTGTTTSTSAAPRKGNALVKRQPKCPSGSTYVGTKSNDNLIMVSLLGPPGVGKGAFSRHLGPAYKLQHISTGELIRAQIAAKSEIGLRVESIVKSGGLIDDETVVQLLEQALTELPAGTKGVILDGFPRRISQCELIDSGKFNLPKLSAVISITMREDILSERRSGRRFCPSNGRTFNLHGINKNGYFLPPRLPSPADLTACGVPLEVRPDDKPEIAAKRMDEYHKENPAMISYYKQQGNLLQIEKTTSARNLFTQLKPKINQLFRKNQQATCKPWYKP